MAIQDPKISVIVPVYNAEKFLNRCINSILVQTFTNFELLLIDDGSKDKSGEICDEYAKKDNRIRVYHQKNGGAMSARALGVKQSHLYSYITFVDSDDELPVTSLETFAKYCSEKYDIIIGKLDNSIYPISELTKDENRSCAINGTLIRSEPWGRLIKHSLFDDWVFDIPHEIVKGEDMLMNIRLAFKNQKSVKLISEKVYNYSSENEYSIMHTFIPTIEYEEMYSKYQLLSIPTELRDCYVNEIILSQVRGVINVINRTHRQYGKNLYVKDLICKIKEKKIHLPLSYKLKIESCNNFVINIILFWEYVKDNIKKFLS